MAAELRERIGLALYSAKYSDGSDPGDTPESLAEGWEWFKTAPATPDHQSGHAFLLDRAELFRQIDAVLALLPQPSPGEYAGLIEEAASIRMDLALALSTPPVGNELLLLLAKAGRSSSKIANALSSALRERDKWKADYVAVQKVNADWSAYDKGVREAGKALVASALASPVNRISADMQQFWDAIQALRSALSLVPKSKDNGS